jgi:trimethylamine--corrinoid protein Co-methyltransferase
VGAYGEFLSSEHTLRHYKERFYPDLLDRTTYEVWAEGGGETMATRAADKVNKVLVEHQPEYLPEDLGRRLREVVVRAVAQGA